MKNYTPAQIVFRAAFILFIFLIIFQWLLIYLNPIGLFWYQVLGIPFLISLLSYLIFYAALERFIYRKIKLIYKNIHLLKSTKEITDKKVNMNFDIVGNMNNEVMEWAENQNRKIEELRKLEDYRKEFFGNVSHELKTPITSIQGYLETLIDGGLEDPKINKAYLEKANRNVERMISIIDDLENIAKLESRELPITFELLDAHAVCMDVFEDLEVLAEKMHITLEFKEGCDKAFYVIADKKMLREVFVNLILNGIKYGKEFGFVHVGFYSMGENLLVEISDNGIGISKENLERVFERFYRVEKSRSRNFGGTGLGLSIVKHILEAHDQSVTVRSTLGIGSTFGFTLKKGNRNLSSSHHTT